MNEKQQLLNLLQEFIDSGKDSQNNLDMRSWVSPCGTSCCLCGDVAIKRADSSCNLIEAANKVSLELSALIRKVTISKTSAFIWGNCSNDRTESAVYSSIFTDKELKHPHLTSDHNDRAIAHDFIRLIMDKVNQLPE